jgi:cytochrome P450
VENPLEVDFDRTVSRHLAFSAGPHRCLGSHLARLEIRVFLEEWLKRIPEFSIKASAELQYRGGKIIELTALPLVWDAA